jgi:hypothetical protein
MQKGRSNLLVGQTGEYLVAAELARRGLIATTFTGNVPHYDIIASDESGRHVSVQVKASRRGSWMVGDIRNYCEISFEGKRQVVGARKACPVARLVVVMVRVDESRDDRFYVCRWEKWRDFIVDHHEAYLARHGGIRPKRWDSLHVGISEDLVGSCRDQWEVVEESLL